MFRWFFSLVEKQVLNNAIRVNVVSEGFPPYFQKKGVDTQEWSFFPNGVDTEFVGVSAVAKIKKKGKKTILYAGNIGSGQGLERIIPLLARELKEGFRFVVVGDGGTSRLLSEELNREGVDNVELIPPVGRQELLEYYQEADLLFLHLNDILAFQRVLPSKIFEYAALGKPLVAGLSGYSAQFLRNYVPYAVLFAPGNKTEGRRMEIEVSQADVSRFVKRFSRQFIMEQMADHWLEEMVK